MTSAPPPSISSPAKSMEFPTMTPELNIPGSLIRHDAKGNYYIVATTEITKNKILIPITFMEEKTK